MKRSFELLLSLISKRRIFIEVQTGRPLLKEEVKSSPVKIIKLAHKRDIPNIVDHPAWYAMLSSGDAFFAECEA